MAKGKRSPVGRRPAKPSRSRANEQDKSGPPKRFRFTRICAWCGVPIYISVEDPDCDGLHYDCVWDRSHSRRRGDSKAQREAAQDRSAVLRKQERGLLAKPEPPPEPEPEPDLQYYIPGLTGMPST